MLEENEHDNCRAYKTGAIISQNICAGMDDMHLLSSYLDLHDLETNRKFIPKNKPFAIDIFCVSVEESKYEAKHCAVMINNSYAIFCTISSIDNDNNKMFANPAKMTSEKKLFALKFEHLCFEP